MDEIKDLITKTARQLFGAEAEHEVTRTQEKFGDFASNIALKLAKQVGKAPRDIATELTEALSKTSEFSHVEVAGPGFINIRLTDQALFNLTEMPTSKSLKGKTIVTEYSDPNPFKVLHAGHLYTSVIGDSIANLLESAGATVHRVNYGGDVGLHVGKTLWAALKDLGGEEPGKLANITDHSEWLAKCYIEGTAAYEEDLQAREDIIKLNKRVYELHKTGDKESDFARVYWTCREWSYAYFKEFYARIGTKFEKFYPESAVAAEGEAKVRQQLAEGVYEESDGAVVFRADQYGLHTRVFVTHQGLPTYEAKEVGLIFRKKQDYNFDRSVVITGSEQKEYMAVVLKSIEQYAPDLVAATTHITHGLVKLVGGVKMSSRKGNILRARDVLDVAAEALRQAHNEENADTSLAAVKYAFLKQRLGGDITYDPEDSVSMQGNSGPYIQYAHARGSSILKKSSKKPQKPAELEKDERSLLRKISEYKEVQEQAMVELRPHHICTYLYELAQSFNRFYETNRIIGHERETERSYLVWLYTQTLSSGLKLLGITAPEFM